MIEAKNKCMCTPRYQSRIDSGVNGGNTAVRYFGHVVREASGMENCLMCTRMKEKGRERRPTRRWVDTPDVRTALFFLSFPFVGVMLVSYHSAVRLLSLFFALLSVVCLFSPLSSSSDFLLSRSTQSSHLNCRLSRFLQPS